MEKVVLVDMRDRALGLEEKMTAHEKGRRSVYPERYASCAIANNP